MPNEFLRNLNTGLGLASQINQYSSNQMALSEQRRQVQEQEQYRGALTSLREGRELPEGTPANIGMQAESDFLQSQVQKLESTAFMKRHSDIKQAKAYRDSILSQDFETMEEVYEATRLDTTGDFSISAQVIGTGLIAEALQAEEGTNHIFKERNFTRATQELNIIGSNLFDAVRFAKEGRNRESSELALRTVNESHAPFFLEEVEQGVFNLYFKEFGDDGERQLIREGMSLTDVAEEVEKVSPQVYHAIYEDRLETLSKRNKELRENPTVLYSNTGGNFLLLPQMNFEGELEVFIEFPDGSSLTDNHGQPKIFSSEAEARQTLKQFLSETDENFRGLDEDARTALSFNEKKERESGPMSIPDSARIHSAVLEALEDSDMSLTDVQARKLSSQVADLMSEKGEGKELNEAIVQVFKQFIEDDPHLKERTKGFDWSKWIGPGQALKAGDFVSGLIKDLFKGRDRDYVEVDFNDTSSGEGEDPLNERDLGIDHNLFK